MEKLACLNCSCRRARITWPCSTDGWWGSGEKERGQRDADCGADRDCWGWTGAEDGRYGEGTRWGAEFGREGFKTRCYKILSRLGELVAVGLVHILINAIIQIRKFLRFRFRASTSALGYPPFPLWANLPAGLPPRWPTLPRLRLLFRTPHSPLALTILDDGGHKVLCPNPHWRNDPHSVFILILPFIATLFLT